MQKNGIYCTAGFLCKASNKERLTFIMKTSVIFTTIIILFTNMVSASPGFGQDQEKKLISLDFKNAPLQKVFAAIEAKANVVIMYENTLILKKEKVSISVTNTKVSDILDQLLKNKSLQWSIRENVIRLETKQAIPTAVFYPLETFIPPLPGIDVTVVVLDSAGRPLEGASIRVKGTQRGITSGADGRAVLKSIAPNSTLLVSFTGYGNREVAVGNNKIITIRLSILANALNEVVVLGFGTQKKANVTGAISTVSGADLISRPVGNITNMLIGSTTGVSGLQTSGEPGQNADQIYIRGMSTYGNSQPLIVIDGVEQPEEQAYTELNGMDPNEISSISVLKDAASSAVYGIRGANGVIIVTTKRGKMGKPVFNLSLNFGSTKAIDLFKQVTAYEWASMRNNAITISANDLGNTSYNAYLFSADQLWKMKNNRDYTPDEVAFMPGLTDSQRTQLNASPAYFYKSTDLVKQLFGNSGPQKQLNFNVSGGNDRVRYYASLGYFTQNGIGINMSYGGASTGSSFNRYNFKSNFDIHLNKNTELFLNLTGQFGTETSFGAKSTSTGSILSPNDLSQRYLLNKNMVEGNALNFPGLIDGKLVSGPAGNAGGFGNPLGLQGVYSSANDLITLFQSGTGFLTNTLIDNNIKLIHTMNYVTKGLSVHATADYQNNYTKFISEITSIPTYTIQRDAVNPNKLDFYGGSIGSNSFSTNNSTWSKIYFDAGIDYNRTFGAHKITALFLGKASQYTMPGDVFNTPSGLMGLVGRMTYNYKERYLLEYDLGFNGTEQFEPNQRFGYFPAYSVGWVPTNEAFFKENKWITFLKIRSSYGEVGNDMLGGRRYLYLPNSYNMNLSNQSSQGYYLGNSNGSSSNAYYHGASEGALGNPIVTWEKSKKLDIGLESRFFSDRLSFTADYFHESRSNILTNSGVIPLTFGVLGSNTPPINIGSTVNRGYELSMTWKDKTGQVGYSVNLGVSYAKNKILYQAEAPNPYPWMNRTGFPIGQYFGLVNDGFFNTPQELANGSYNTYVNNVATLGDIRYKDLNGDGIIDNKDIAPIGYTNLPQYHFNATLGINYKGFDASVLFIGTANGSYMLNLSAGSYVIPFWKSTGNVWQWQYDGQWTAAKAASGAKISFPRPIIDGSNSSSDSYLSSDFWLKSNNFIRIKNLEVGYTLPTGLTKHLSINSLRAYFNASNLFTFKNALSQYGVDPEQTDNGSIFLYPFTKVINFGLNVQF
jgi:TonB-linked SusC/RagA family outer membrane protein